MARIFGINLILFLLIRVYLIATIVMFGTSTPVIPIIRSLFVGAFFDLIVLCYAFAPLIAIRFVLPKAYHFKKWFRIFQGTYLLVAFMVFLFAAFGEPFFWDEFKSRYNFIAVDYLIYTTEVINNIWESYPFGWFLFFVAILSAGLSYWALKNTNETKSWQLGFVVLLLVLDSFLFSQAIAESTPYREANELSKNGIYSFLSAYFHNEINYTEFYATRDEDQVISRLEKLFPESQVTKEHGIHRHETPSDSEQRRNVILVVMESLSAKFMDTYGSKDHITPNLDRLTNEGLFFRNMFATGTRTVRGLEALTLAVPPTPGQSIVRRPEGKNLFNLGSVFRQRGYKTQFIYGGYSYFDNMKEYFISNGFEIIDQGSLTKEEITFSNAWGVCDEDLFKRVEKEADLHHKNKKPFFHVVLTTSNHRPYTYPDNKIDIPSGSGRGGAVKYADYAIGEFLKNVERKPWYKNTLFVFASDHNAGLSGKAQVPLEDYTIPVIFYNPNFVKKQIHTELSSQIDIVPTILGYLNWKYDNRFFGEDLNKKSPNRAFVSNFQFVGLYKNNELVILGPKQKIDRFQVASLTNLVPLPPEGETVEDTIAYYQGAALFYRNRALLENLPSKKSNPKAASNNN
ncbi:MAG: hypothetical protein A4S09_02670 [Proteobacteria bacterium SG_bin7]|nr:MAG: hypothetical protein A4S09_02670 [Proteobacteria bacterium SG_bin7]